MKEGRKAEYPEKTPEDKLQKVSHTKTWKFKPQTETWTRTLALVAGLESRHANHYTMHRPNL